MMSKNLEVMKRIVKKLLKTSSTTIRKSESKHRRAGMECSGTDQLVITHKPWCVNNIDAVTKIYFHVNEELDQTRYRSSAAAYLKVKT